MEPASEETKQRLDFLTEGLGRAGVKLTHQRLEIMRELAGSGEHPDADAVWKGVRMRMPTLSLDTVYRTLGLLLDLGLIATLGPSRERTRFDANMNSHHHFVCSVCGMTRDFNSENSDNLKVPSSVLSFGQIQTTRVEARGICFACAGKR